MPKARDVANRNLACVVQFRADYAYGRFDPNPTGPNAVQMSKRREKPDGAMAAHAEISDVIEEDNPCIGGRISRWTQQRSHDCVRTARFVDNSGSNMVKVLAKPNKPLTDAAGSQIGAATEHDPGGFTAGMRVYDLNAHSLIIRDCPG
jgi:hypothetical protein